MPSIILFNKPFQVLSQFTDENNRTTLKEFIPDKPGFYVAGRLDFDSEGLLLLTNHGPLQHYIAHPKFDKKKTYWVQVEGEITPEAIKKLASGVTLKDGTTKPTIAKRIDTPPELWPRTPPIRERQSIPTSWLSLTLTEGKNRQVRRMTAAVGFPTLRLIRGNIDNWGIDDLKPGEFRQIEVSMPDIPKTRKNINPKNPKKANHKQRRQGKVQPSNRLKRK